MRTHATKSLAMLLAILMILSAVSALSVITVWAVDELPFNYINDAYYPFDIVGTTIYSTNHAHNSTSYFTYIADRTVTFDLFCGVSSESGWDYLFVQINDEYILDISGENTGYDGITLYAGDRLCVGYSKDESGHVGDDCGWVDFSDLIEQLGGAPAETAPEKPDGTEPTPDYGKFDYWDGSVADGFGGGSGTEYDPYLICTGAQLAYLAELVNGDANTSGQYFKLMNHINLQGIAWTPIGISGAYNDYNTCSFKGHFDGNGYSVINMTIDSDDCPSVGLFGAAQGATITDLFITNASVSADYSDNVLVAILCGKMKNTTVERCIAQGELYGCGRFTFVGIITAYMYGSTVRNCGGIGSVSAASNTYNTYAGGIVGCMESGAALVDCSYFFGDVSVTSRSTGYAGGVVGVGTSGQTITNCYMIGSVNSANYAAGIASRWNGDAFTVQNCYYNGTLDGYTTTSHNYHGTETGQNNLMSAAWLSANLGWDFVNTWIFADDSGAPALRCLRILAGGEEQPPHEHTVVEEITDATCYAPGYHREVCSVCGRVLSESIIPQLSHNYTSEVISEAICGRDGLIVYTCVYCGHSYEVTTHAEHNYELTVEDATCTQDGRSVYRCTNCGDVYSIVIPAGHSYTSEVTVHPTRETEGEMTYTCSKCGDNYIEVIPASNANILLVQDSLPWGQDSNRAVLNHLMELGHISGWTTITTARLSEMELTNFDVIIIAGDQSSSAYSNLAAMSIALTAFVQAGGVVVYSACDAGWGGGYIHYTLPGGVVKLSAYSQYNYIADSAHPIVTGALTDDRALTNTLLVGTYCSHTSFDRNTLPAGANVILQDGNGNPTLVEYPLGEGSVIATGLTWEYYYNSIHTGNTSFSMNAYDDLIAYATQLRNLDVCRHTYDEGITVNATCLTEGYTLYTCTECGAAYKSNYESALGHAMGTWIMDAEATCMMAGSRHQTCNRCGERVYEIIPASGHDYVLQEQTDPTCSSNGISRYRCEYCQDEVRSVLAPLPHTDSEWIVESEPTADREGYKYRYCLTCDQLLEEKYTRLFTVTFLNYDGSVLSTMQVVEDAEAVYGGPTPARPNDDDCSYRFIGWDASLYSVTSDMTVGALYERVVFNNIVGFRPVQTAVVEYNTPIGDIDLPDVMIAICANGEEHALPVIWQTDRYNPRLVGTQSILGVVAVPDDLTSSIGNTASVHVKVSPSETPEIIEITKVYAPANMTAPYGTLYGMLGLPKSVRALTAHGGEIEVPVDWIVSGYDATTYGEQRLTGVLRMPYCHKLADGVSNRVTVMVTVTETVITAIDAIDIGLVPVGCPFENIGLPGTVAVTTAAGAVYYMPVEWDGYNYNGSWAETQTIFGTVQLGEGFVPADGLEAVVSATVTPSDMVIGQADIVFLIDTTGSMYDEIQNVKNNIRQFAQRLNDRGIVLRWALIEYRDITCDGADSTRIHLAGYDNWYIDVRSFQDEIARLTVTGGGDREETVIDALEAARLLDTREGVDTFFVVVTDADYKSENNYGVASMEEEIETLRADGIVTSVVTKPTYYGVYRPLTDVTGGLLTNIDGNFATELAKLADMIQDVILDRELVGIEITTRPNNITYYAGYRFDGAGMVISALYSDGSSRPINAYTVSPGGPLSLSDSFVEISYRGHAVRLPIAVLPTDIPVEGIELGVSSVDLELGYALVPEIYLYPENASNQHVTFNTDNINVAEVLDDGTVIARGAGTATITVTSDDGAYTASFTVTVAPTYIPVTEVDLGRGNADLTQGDFLQLNAVVSPADATAQTVVWTTGDTSIAVVDETGRVTAIGVGMTTVTATVYTDEGVYESHCLITVGEPVIPATPQLVIGSATVTAGEEFYIDLTLENLPFIKSLALYDFTYDTSRLELLGGEWLLSDAILSQWDAYQQTAVLTYSQNSDANGTAFRLYFRALEDLTAAQVQIGCSVNTITVDDEGYEISLAIEIVNGTVLVYGADALRGDVNGDGYLTVDDATYLLQHLLMPDVYGYDGNADMNGDGRADSNDAVYLLRSILMPEQYPLR